MNLKSVSKRLVVLITRNQTGRKESLRTSVINSYTLMRRVIKNLEIMMELIRMSTY